jgi:hypothetical protein
VITVSAKDEDVLEEVISIAEERIPFFKELERAVFIDGDLFVASELDRLGVAYKKTEDPFYDDHQYKHMGPGPHPSGSEQDVHAGDGVTDRARQWVDSLSPEELSALRQWGRWGHGVRKIQSGQANTLTDRDRRNAERALPHWESALKKGVAYEGEVYRGITRVPEETLENWKPGSVIELRNDQSASKDSDVAIKFTHPASKKRSEASVFWKIRQKTGVDLFEQTSVYYGDDPQTGWVSESEVILRKGSKYVVKSTQWFNSEGEHHLGNGRYVIELEEVE